jgi:hypothetical protein
VRVALVRELDKTVSRLGRYWSDYAPRMRGSGPVVGLLVVVLTACSPGSDPEGCTMMGARQGVGVQVAAGVAPIRDLELTWCVEGDCTDSPVRLSAGDAAGSPTCEGVGDDEICGVELTPDGTQYGRISARKADLPEGPVEVSGSYRAGGRVVTIPRTTVQATTNYPNGRRCGADGTSANVTLDADGLS